jgi:(p)ppGpp synthase/HD superfamily hydrolase
LFIKGSEGMVVSFGRCCRPIPGDDIIGHLSSGRGIVVHTQSCNNLSDFNSRPNNWIDVDWEAEVDRVFPIDMRVQVENQKGVLATVAAAISEMDVNIDYVNIDDRDGLYSALNFTIEVRDRRHLADIIRRVRRIPLVQKVSRQAN